MQQRHEGRGFSAEDMHGFITVVPAGFPELAYCMGKGYQYINPFRCR